MSGYEWQGSGQHGGFVRAGSRLVQQPGDLERDQALSAAMAGVAFYCETCRGFHPLAEHQACRARPRR